MTHNLLSFILTTHKTLQIIQKVISHSLQNVMSMYIRSYLSCIDPRMALKTPQLPNPYELALVVLQTQTSLWLKLIA